MAIRAELAKKDREDEYAETFGSAARASADATTGRAS